jgi:predicted metal-dependent hydrolase
MPHEQADEMPGERDEGLTGLFPLGIRHFNDCDFFEAHEAWEGLWTEYRGPARGFLQGLIQVAVALHHFGNGNLRGARKVYLSSRGYLEGYRPHYAGLDLDSFLEQYRLCFADLLEDDQARVEIDPERIPEIHLRPECGAPDFA